MKVGLTCGAPLRGTYPFSSNNEDSFPRTKDVVNILLQGENKYDTRTFMSIDHSVIISLLSYACFKMFDHFFQNAQGINMSVPMPGHPITGTSRSNIIYS